MNNNFIQHGGPGSGRYPLGSGGRPYQKFEKAKRKVSKVASYVKKKKNQRKQKIAKKQADEIEKKKRIREANKEKVLRKGSASEVLEYQGELTNQQLQEAFTRLNLEANIRSLSSKEKSKNMRAVDDVMKTIKAGNEWVKIGTDSYNTFASIYNATDEGKRHPLTLIKKK